MHLCFLLPNSSCMASLESHEDPCQNSHLDAGRLWVWGCRPGRSWGFCNHWMAWGLQCSRVVARSTREPRSTRACHTATGEVLRFLFPAPSSQLPAPGRLVIREPPLPLLMFTTGVSSLCLCFIYVLSCQTGKLCRVLSSRSGEQDKAVFMGRALKPVHFCHLSKDRSSYTRHPEFLLSNHHLVSFCRKCPWNFDRA